MFHRPKRCVVFGMNTRGVAVQVAPAPDKMKPEDMGMYVHADEYDKALELLDFIEEVRKGVSTDPASDLILNKIDKFKKELTPNGVSQR